MDLFLTRLVIYQGLASVIVPAPQPTGDAGYFAPGLPPRPGIADLQLFATQVSPPRIAASGADAHYAGAPKRQNTTDLIEPLSGFPLAPMISGPVARGGEGHYAGTTKLKNTTDLMEPLSGQPPSGQVPSAATPWGWWQPLSERAARVVPASVQQWAFWQAFGSPAIVVTITQAGAEGYYAGAQRRQNTTDLMEQAALVPGVQAIVNGADAHYAGAPRRQNTISLMEPLSGFWPAPMITAGAFVPNLESFVVTSCFVLGETEQPLFQVPSAQTPTGADAYYSGAPKRQGNTDLMEQAALVPAFLVTVTGADGHYASATKRQTSIDLMEQAALALVSTTPQAAPTGADAHYAGVSRRQNTTDLMEPLAGQPGAPQAATTMLLDWTGFDAPPRRFRKVKSLSSFSVLSVETPYVDTIFSVVWTRPLNAAQVTFSYFGPQETFVAPTQYGWWQPFAEARKASAPAAVRPFDAWVGYQVPTSQVTGWWQPLDVRFATPMRASLQVHAFFQPAGTITSVLAGSTGWNGVSPEIAIGYTILEQQNWPPTTPPIVVAAPNGASSFFDASRVPGRPLKPDQFWAGYQIPTAATPQGWTASGFDPARPFRRPDLGMQASPPPATAAATTVSYGWQAQGLDGPVRRGGRPVAGEAGPGVIAVPASVNFNWQPSFADLRYVRPLKLTLQQHDAWPMRAPVTLGPWGWTHFVDAIRKAPRAEAFTVLQIFGFVDNTTTKGWWPTAWIDPRFHYGFKATLQQDAFQVMRSGIFVPPTILARPQLKGQDDRPSLLGQDDAPRLTGLYGSVTLTGKVS